MAAKGWINVAYNVSYT